MNHVKDKKKEIINFQKVIASLEILSKIDASAPDMNISSMISGVDEWASKRTKERIAKRASEKSNAKQANKWVVRTI